MKRTWLVSFYFFLSVTDLVAQTILIRELLVSFSGNEIAIGIILVSWLLGASLGSFLAGKYAEKGKDFSSPFLLSSFLILIFLVLSLFFCRCLKASFGIPIYEIISPSQMLYSSFLLIMPLSFLFGVTFILAARLWKKEGRKNPVGFIYILDALGAATGGIIFTYFLVERWGSFAIVTFLILVNLSLAIVLSFFQRRFKILFLCTLSLIFSLHLFSSGNLNKFRNLATERQFKGQTLIKYANSKYGNIAVTRQGETYLVYHQGSLYFTTEDTETNEELAHLVLLSHQKPKKVLLIGGSPALIGEILKYKVAVDYVELDPKLIDASKDFLSPEAQSSLANPRVKIFYGDGRFFVKNCRKSFDIVIVNLPDPINVQLNRFYTKEFYQEVKKILNKDGIMAVKISSKEDIITKQVAKYNASIYKTISTSFAYLTLIPGEKLLILGSATPREESANLLIKRLKKRRIKTVFFTPYHIQQKFYRERIDYLRAKISRELKTARINYDFRPISFYYDAVLWALMFNPQRALFWERLEKLNLGNLSILLLFLFLIAFFSIRKTRGRIYLSIMAIGFSGILLQVILLISFQVLYGYVYAKIGLLIAGFMLGLGIGAILAYKKKEGRELPAFIKVQSSIFIYALILPFIFILLAKINYLQDFAFFLLSGISGLLVGMAFPLATKICGRGDDTIETGGKLYGIDLLGASLGTLLGSVILIPILGIPHTCFLVAILNFFCIILRRSGR